jgi:hypothetical protein
MLGLTGNMYKEISGTAFSFVMLIALTGNIIINYITGVLVQNYSISILVYVILTEIIIMMGLYSLIRKDIKSL